MSKLRFSSPDKDFRAGHHVPLPPYRRGINDGTPFMDPWKNPYLVRGVPRSEAERRQADDGPLNKHPEVPYVTAVGGNKSAVLPNDIFDVIHEAETSGGVTFRHRARSRRFGVPDSCDDRQEHELFIPPPPCSGTKSLKDEHYVEGPTTVAVDKVFGIDQAVMAGGPPQAY